MFALLVESPIQILNEPIATFVLLLAIVLATPPIFERFKLPGLIGLLVAGVIFGDSGLGWLQSETETMKLLADMGKIYLMFVAGLEIDLVQFQRTRNRSLCFGLLTFALPMIGGIAVGLWFNFSWLAAVLIGSLLASHTLLAYPIIQRLGVAGDEAVTITVGATIFTDIGSLLVLAICLGVNQGDFTLLKLLALVGSLALYALAVLWGLRRFGQYFFQRTGEDEGNQFLFVLLSVFLCSVVAQLIGVEGIIGAFLAGLAINSVIGDGPVKEKTEFLGTVLFIPMFFVNMGLLLDLKAFGNILASLEIPLLIVSVLLAAKLLAALATKQLFRYSRPQFWTIASLSFPQVAATLAAAMVGYQANIINIQVFNSVILMMLVTSILGPIMTTRFARQLATTETLAAGASRHWLPLPGQSQESLAIVVPVYNLKTERFLLELASLMAGAKQGQIIPLAIAVASSPMHSPQMSRAIAHCRRRLEAAEIIHEVFGISVKPKLRMRTAHCPVIVARLVGAPATLKKLLLPIRNPTPEMLRVLRVAQVLATANQGQITLLHVYDSWVSKSTRIQNRTLLDELVALLPVATCRIEIQLQQSDNVVNTLREAAYKHDAVMLRSQRHRMDKGVSLGLSSSLSIEQLPGSVIVVGEPSP